MIPQGPTLALEIGGRVVELSNLDRVMWPRTGFTKGDLVEYYRRAAPALLRHLARRPVTLARFPEGLDGPGWYQTNCRGHPPWMTPHEVVSRTGEILRYCVIDELPSLLWAANQGTIELHPLPWTVDRPDMAPVVVFDLDPGKPAGLTETCRAALALRLALEEVGLRCLVKTSGSKGLHLLVPLNGSHGFEETKGFARRMAEGLALEDPQRITDRTARNTRAGKVFVDWLQNDAGRSIAAPYSLRAAPVPRVSTPVTWEEVEAGAEGRELRFSPAAALERMEATGDLFSPVLDVRQPLPAV